MGKKKRETGMNAWEADVLALVGHPEAYPHERVRKSFGGKGGMIRCRPAEDWCRMALGRKNPRSLWMSLWYEGEVCCLFADSNLGKSIYAVQIAEEISRSERVIYFDFELSDKMFQLRYTDSEGRIYPFNPNFFRAEIDVSKMVLENFEDAIIREIELLIVRKRAKVIIIDNITWLGMACESTDAAGLLMIRLRQLSDIYGLSILVVAHTPKRSLTSPITQNDLAGSKRLFNFFSSVFAIGRSARDEDIRYIKQLKTRVGGIRYGGDNVIVARIVKDGAMTRFRIEGYERESAHIEQNWDSERNCRREDVIRRYKEGETIRRIAKEMNLSKSAVGRIVKGITRP